MLPNRLLPALVLALAAWALFLTGCTPKFSQEDVDRSGISLAEVRALVETEDHTPAKGTLIVDARGPSSFGAGHIPGAKNFAITKFSGKHGETDPALEDLDTIVVYADNPGSGAASALALRMMSTGYKNVRTFFEGFDAWKRAGLAVEKNESALPTPAPAGGAPKGEAPKKAK